jgi:hypothetical protein
MARGVRSSQASTGIGKTVSSSSSRDELEKLVRSYLPRRRSGDPATTAQRAGLGLGGLLTGFTWGYWRGRRRSRR